MEKDTKNMIKKLEKYNLSHEHHQDHMDSIVKEHHKTEAINKIKEKLGSYAQSVGRMAQSTGKFIGERKQDLEKAKGNYEKWQSEERKKHILKLKDRKEMLKHETAYVKAQANYNKQIKQARGNESSSLFSGMGFGSSTQSQIMPDIRPVNDKAKKGKSRDILNDMFGGL